MADPTITRTDVRERIVDVAARLLRDEGSSAVTTRGVALAAGVQAPTIYRLFGDKDGLLEAVAEHVMASFVSDKRAVVEEASANGIDPLVDLRTGWQTQIDFGLANPELFRLLSNPDRVRNSPAAASGRRILEARVSRLAVAGLLRVSEERAVALIQAAGVGSISTLLATPVEQRDPGLADEMYEAVLGQILRDVPERTDDPVVAATVAFRAIVPAVTALSSTERQLLTEWLDRAIGTP